MSKQGHGSSSWNFTDRSFPQYYYITGMYDIYVSTITARDQNKKWTAPKRKIAVIWTYDYFCQWTGAIWVMRLNFFIQNWSATKALDETISPSPEDFLISFTMIVGIMTIVCVLVWKIPGDICGPNVLSISTIAEMPAGEISVSVPCAAWATIRAAKSRALSDFSGCAQSFLITCT